MKAKLVTISITRRVVVDNNATEDETILKAINKIRELDDTEIAENLESIEDDVECPYNVEFDGETAEYSISISGSGKRKDIINELEKVILTLASENPEGELESPNTFTSIFLEE